MNSEIQIKINIEQCGCVVINDNQYEVEIDDCHTTFYRNTFKFETDVILSLYDTGQFIANARLTIIQGSDYSRYSDSRIYNSKRELDTEEILYDLTETNGEFAVTATIR